MKIRKKLIKQGVVAAIFLTLGFLFVPVLLIFYMGCGLFDILRHRRRDWTLWQRYFSGNGFTTWLVSPFNLFLDLISSRNPGVYKLSDFSEPAQAEIQTVLDTFKNNRQSIIAEIDAEMKATETAHERRGMFLYRWFGRRYNRSIAALNGDFEHVRTIAVSVFDGKERTNFHFGPMRMTIRVLYNLTPVAGDQVFIECDGVMHYWSEDPLFMFDDTLMHRSVNDHDGRRYCVFLDVLRPSPLSGALRVLEKPISLIATLFKTIYYRRWKMLGMGASSQGSAGS